ncbi:hypothetical protein GGS20DRAFT_42151 [Poronia punctata]|nr:hypothetical protein GGS20DRAFT_42151 [Poronia punctata]
MTSPSIPRPAKPSMRRLVDFFDPAVQGTDPKGRTLDEILSWSDTELERCHDYIQYVFPLAEQSAANYHAPVLDEETVVIFRNSPALQENVMRTLKRMVSFYGFALAEEDEEKISETASLNILPNGNGNSRGLSHWLVPMDHNHLRITRIIRSLRILGLGRAATDFRSALLRVQQSRPRVSSRSVGYWRRAHDEPLQFAPDGSEVPWLKNFS